ncbi:MAG: methionyl-tRNA formyltransferase [Bacteroidales bacterium]|nr:methionyl-tRNA formyltransferase [Bacteroidales bacterium]MBN2756283.1 methionyl-tRNA formyltransferase [Bacteroidales bacterium]
MKAKDIRIVYMGTPDFAVEPLKRLVENNYNIVAVITAPDKPAGRGQKMQESAVKIFAKQHSLNILQPEKLKDENFNAELKSLNPDLQIVVAFRMLPEIVWQLPKLGTFNLHASLLPQYRGAAPINWAIINGEKKTGLTTFLINKDIDTGKIILQKEIAISETENAGKLHDKLMLEGGNLVVKTVDIIAEEKFEALKQDELLKNISKINPAPKIFKPDCKIKWNQSIINIYNFIRGLSPYPAAWSIFRSIDSEKSYTFKIFEAEYLKETHDFLSKDIVSDNKTYFHIAVNEGFIIIKSIQLEGKKRMKIDEFLRGFDLNNFLIDPNTSCLV